jgi:hypothetical protein
MTEQDLSVCVCVRACVPHVCLTPYKKLQKPKTCLLCSEMWHGNEDVQRSGELSVDPNDVTFLLCQISQ